MNEANSLGDDATFARKATARPQRADVSLGDQRTVGGGDAAGLDTVIDDIEVVDLAARYKIEGTLGQGGMGAVLLATDTRLDRKVAIKRILGEAARSKTAIMRFLTEAKAIAALNHPNIVQIYDYGRAKDGPFLIMEHVDGGSLADRCKAGSLPLDQAIELVCQVCDGLGLAHAQGIVHRDIKPANILVSRSGAPKLTDFGLAKAEANDHGMTMTGAIMGTPDFMPPEQRRNASEVDHRSDLWSLAATLYQAVTGRSPKVIRLDLLPASLTKVIGKALEDEQDARYQSAREFCDALKTSARVAAVVVQQLPEGTCPSCGVRNESSRRFCRGCGETLEAPCLSCTKPMPIGEEICGSCGAKQTPVADKRRQGMAVKQAEAEGLLRNFDFDRAAAIAAELRDENHPRLRHLSGWATRFLEQAEITRADQIAKAVDSVDQASKHEAAHDYQSAIACLDQVPVSLRDTALPNTDKSVAQICACLRQSLDDVQRLQQLIKHRVAANQFDKLLHDVEHYLRLKPGDAEILTLRKSVQDSIKKKADLLAQDDLPLAVILTRIQEYLESSPLDDDVRRFRDTVIDRHVDGLREELSFASDKKRFGGVRKAIDAFTEMFSNESPELVLAQTAILTNYKHKRVSANRQIWINALVSPAICAVVTWGLLKASFIESLPLIARAILFCLAIPFGALGLLSLPVILWQLFSLDDEPTAEPSGTDHKPASSPDPQVCSGNIRLAIAEKLYREGRFQDAAKVYAMLTSRMPGNRQPWINLARCHSGLNRWNDALHTLLAVAPRFPDDGLIAYNLACYFTRVDDLPNAISHLRRAIALNPRYSSAAMEDVDFDSIRSNRDFQSLLRPAGCEKQNDGATDDLDFIFD